MPKSAEGKKFKSTTPPDSCQIKVGEVRIGSKPVVAHHTLNGAAWPRSARIVGGKNLRRRNSCTAALTAQCVYSSVSVTRLQKTGVFATRTGDGSEFLVRKPEIPPSRDCGQPPKAPVWRGFLAFIKEILRIADWLAGDAVGFEPVSAGFPCVSGKKAGKIAKSAVKGAPSGRLLSAAEDVTRKSFNRPSRENSSRD